MTEPDEAEVRRALEGWRRAIEARDLDRVMSFYLPDDEFLGFDFVPPFLFSGAAAFREDWRNTFTGLDDDPTFELRDIRVRSGGDLAVAFGLSHFKGTMQQHPTDVWTRQTNAFLKVDNRWLIIHEHASVPIDMASGKGMLDYTP